MAVLVHPTIEIVESEPGTRVGSVPGADAVAATESRGEPNVEGDLSARRCIQVGFHTDLSEVLRRLKNTLLTIQFISIEGIPGTKKYHAFQERVAEPSVMEVNASEFISGSGSEDQPDGRFVGLTIDFDDAGIEACVEVTVAPGKSEKLCLSGFVLTLVEDIAGP
jgi:hypothetical protein